MLLTPFYRGRTEAQSEPIHYLKVERKATGELKLDLDLLKAIR